ncbi:MAG: mandelate racemase/muconate lactonizing enzyme family protein [Pseudomonadota bacterium]
MNDKIISIAPYVIPGDPEPHPWWSRKAYVLVRVETADGVVGWGECHLLSFREDGLVAMIRTVAERWVGRSSGAIRSLLREAYQSFGQQRPGLEVYSAYAGVEIALWDVLGKRLGVPVHQLLGGALYDSVGVYANIYSPFPQAPEKFAEMAAYQAAQGHRAIKLYPFEAGSTVADGVAILAAVRDAVGPDVGLAVDLWRRADPARALELARAMERFELLWIEDPFAPTDPASLRYLRNSMKQPLLTGETLPTRREFAPLFAERAVDIINPDICQSGLLEMQAIAAMAEPAYISLSPHNSNSMALGTAAAVHASLGITNLGLLEYFPLFETALDDLCVGRPPVRDGIIERPDAPGLGIEFDEKAMQKYRL